MPIRSIADIIEAIDLAADEQRLPARIQVAGWDEVDFVQEQLVRRGYRAVVCTRPLPRRRPRIDHSRTSDSSRIDVLLQGHPGALSETR